MAASRCVAVPIRAIEMARWRSEIGTDVAGDTTVEPNETYKVNLSSPTFAVLADSQGIAYIRNDDVSALSAADEPSR